MHRVDSTTGLLGLGKDDEQPAPSTNDAMQPRLDTRTTWAEANASMFELHVPPVPSTNDMLVSAENSIIEDSVHSMATTWTEDRAEDSVISGTTWTEDSAPKREAARLCSRTIALYCVNLFVGLALSQVMPEVLEPAAYHTWSEVVRVVTMFHLSYIVINVGFEFDIDKSHLRSYGKDYMVAMTAACGPWILVSVYFMYALGEEHNLHWQTALVAGRFAAPTSAGLLFTMLEAVGMRETWLFSKARLLALLDDLDTLILMVPLKTFLTKKVKWELSIDLIFVLGLLILMYKGLHRVPLPKSWYFVALYALSITAFCELVHWMTSSSHVDHSDWIETVHLEVLLPSFTMGTIVKDPHEHSVRGGGGVGGSRHAAGQSPSLPATPWSRSPAGKLHRQTTLHLKRAAAAAQNVRQDKFKQYVSAAFMVLVGLSMPSAFNSAAAASAASASPHRRALLAGHNSTNINSTSSSASSLEDGAPAVAAVTLVLHVVACSLLMNLGKIVPAFCYRSEVDLRTRIALAIGMMPRGEVCAGIIVNAIALGVSGVSITIAVLCLALNMACVSGFIFAVKTLATPAEGTGGAIPARRRTSRLGLTPPASWTPPPPPRRVLHGGGRSRGGGLEGLASTPPVPQRYVQRV